MRLIGTEKSGTTILGSDTDLRTLSCFNLACCLLFQTPPPPMTLEPKPWSPQSPMPRARLLFPRTQSLAEELLDMVGW